ncbi:4-coumarate--CoA ligase 1-like [Pararge aegeria]|uniref:Jg15374 protein n=1 Tax=Pararge aegeria aegeria TaxID=348720 RepID=A0A8S4SAF3_9NEOP|nr:4-coumarate--CoA ligase 1-like [Pararge aegeria]CAH2254762.1 jg15374 [Pararge aegeria aegeria]
MFAEQIKNGIIYGDQNFFVPPHLNIGAFVLEKILGHNDRVALINGETEEQITYREMVQNIVNIAAALTDLGIKIGDVVAIASENRLEYFVTSIAVFCCGGISTFFNNAYTKNELIHAVNISKPKFIFLSGEVFKKQYETLKSINIIQKFILYDDKPTSNDCLNYRDLSERHVDINSYKPIDFKGTNQTCMVLYTSGTTGSAKGAKVTHLNLIVACQQKLTVSSELTPLSIAPWSSTMGQLLTLQNIYDGTKLVFLPKYIERLYIKTIEKYKIGYLAIAPPIVVMLCKSTIVNEYDISSVKILLVGGAPTYTKTIRQVRSRFPHIKHVLQGYGITEASGAVCREMELAHKEGSVGQIVLGMIIKVVDPETNKIVGVGEPGEVRISGPTIFDGYIGKDKKDDFDEEGFYKTGDIAYYDKEGYFFIVDRIKEIIKYKAWQVAPSELEGLLLQHPAVKEAGVTGAPDILAGELPTAFVVKQPGFQVTKQEIIAYITEQVAPWKRLRGGVIFVDEIPKTPSGKILRRKLRALLPKQSPQNIPASKL